MEDENRGFPITARDVLSDADQIAWRTQTLLEKLRSILKADNIDAVERTVAIWVQENALPNSSGPPRIRGLLQMLREIFSARQGQDSVVNNRCVRRSAT